MSQAGINSFTGSVLPPDVPTSFPTDINSPAIPAGNVLNVLGGSVSTDNVHGIQTDGSSGSNTLTVELTNRLTGSGTSTNGSTVTLIDFALTNNQSYRFTFDVIGRDTTSGDTYGYKIFATVKRIAGVVSIIDTPFDDSDEDNILASLAIAISGTDIHVDATGVAGTTIIYKAVGTYVVV
jgi:hypothetical protein